VKRWALALAVLVIAVGSVVLWRISYSPVPLSAQPWPTTSPLPDPTRMSVVLPPEAVSAVRRLCSRASPGPIEAAWLPSASDVQGLESCLDRLESLLQPGQPPILSPKRYYRQYVGVVIGGKHLIYINAVSGWVPPDNFEGVLTRVCDGGQSAWGALYDPGNGAISDVQINGT